MSLSVDEARHTEPFSPLPASGAPRQGSTALRQHRPEAQRCARLPDPTDTGWGPTGGSSGLHFAVYASHSEGMAFRNVASVVTANSQVNSQKVAYLKGLLKGEPVCTLCQSILAALREQEDQHCKALPKPV